MIRFEVGDIIDGDFEIVEELGEGNYGAVFRVRHLLDDLEYALKLFLKGGSEKEVRREVRALKLVHHPSVVRFVWAGTVSDGGYYLLTELIEGVSLDGHPAWGEPLPLDKVEAWASQLLGALIAIYPDQARIDQLEEIGRERGFSGEEYDELQQLHAEGLVHRDVKPQNILVRSSTDELILVDFNIASRAGTQVGTQASTPAYQPPDADLTRWTVDVDLFAAGVVIYQLVCGVHPYPGDQPHHPQGPTPANTHVAELPPAVAEFLEVAVAANREGRFPTAVAMLEALHSALKHDQARGETVPPEGEDAGLAGGQRSDSAEVPAHDLDWIDESDYVEWTVTDLPSAGSNQRDVIEGLMSIVEVEGPIVCERLYELYVRGSRDPGVASVKTQLNRAIHRAVSTGILAQVEPLGGGQIDKTVHLPDRPSVVRRERGPRLFQHVPQSEVEAVIDWFTDEFGVEGALPILRGWYGVEDEPWNVARLDRIFDVVVDRWESGEGDDEFAEEPIHRAYLAEGDPRWEEHSGRDGHRGPDWGPGDVERLSELIATATPRLRTFLSVLSHSPGVEFDAEELASELGVVGAAGVAGALSPFKFWRNQGRSLPFRWWKNEGSTTYAMKPSVAVVIREILDRFPTMESL